MLGLTELAAKAPEPKRGRGRPSKNQLRLPPIAQPNPEGPEARLLARSMRMRIEEEPKSSNEVKNPAPECREKEPPTAHECSKSELLANAENRIEQYKGDASKLAAEIRYIVTNDLFNPPYSSIEKYGRKRWGLAQRTTFYYLSLAELLERCPKIADSKVPIMSLRPILSLPRDRQEKAWDAAVAVTREGKPAAAQIRLAAAQFASPKPKTVWTPQAGAQRITTAWIRAVNREQKQANPAQFRELHSLLPEIVTHVSERTKPV